MKLNRRGFIKGLASLALLPSLAWARLDKLEAPQEEMAQVVLEPCRDWDAWAEEYGVVAHEGTTELTSYANAALEPQAAARVPETDDWPDSLGRRQRSAGYNVVPEGCLENDSRYYTPEEIVELDELMEILHKVRADAYWRSR